MNTTQVTWTILGVGNGIGEILDLITLLKGTVTTVVLNQTVSDELLHKLPESIVRCELDTFTPQTECYCFGFLDPHKQALLDHLAPYKLAFPNLIHPSATVSPSVQMGRGNCIGAGAVVGSAATLGDFNYINRTASLGHDASLGSFNHLGPGAVVAGRSRVGDACFLGANATLIDGLTVTNNVTLGAGSVAVHDLDAAGTYVGVPARLLKNYKA